MRKLNPVNLLKPFLLYNIKRDEQVDNKSFEKNLVKMKGVNIQMRFHIFLLGFEAGFSN